MINLLTAPERQQARSYSIKVRVNVEPKQTSKTRLVNIAYDARNLFLKPLFSINCLEMQTTAVAEIYVTEITDNISPHTIQVRRTITTRLVEAVKALALCHNVTPVSEDQAAMSSPGGSSESASSESSDVELYSLDRSGRAQRNGIITYQASSPDEVIK